MTNLFLWTAPDGRTLEWSDTGDPDGAVVVFFHGYLGSLHQAALAEHDLLRFGLRCIAVNRPGVGRSSPHRYATMAEHAADVLSLLDEIGVRRFATCGASAGAGYALACGALAAERTRFVALASMLPPGNVPGLLESMHLLRRSVLYAAERRPRTLDAAAGALLAASRLFPLSACKAMRRLNARLVPGDLPDPDGLLAALDCDTAAVFGPACTATSLTQDLRLSYAWGFAPEDARVPVGVWHGEDDSIVPLRIARAYAAALPDARLHVRQGGHFMLVPALPDILAEVARPAADARGWGDEDERRIPGTAAQGMVAGCAQAG